MPLQPSVVPSRLSTPSPPRRLSRTRHTAFINFCSDRTVAKMFEITLYLFCREKDL